MSAKLFHVPQPSIHAILLFDKNLGLCMYVMLFIKSIRRKRNKHVVLGDATK